MGGASGQMKHFFFLSSQQGATAVFVGSNLYKIKSQSHDVSKWRISFGVKFWCEELADKSLHRWR